MPILTSLTSNFNTSKAISSADNRIFNPTLMYTLDNPNQYGTSLNDYFGISLAMTDEYIMVGSHELDTNGNFGSGRAYKFNVQTGSLEHTFMHPTLLANSYFSESLTISNTYIIICAYGSPASGNIYSGQVHVYNSNNNLVTSLYNPNPVGTQLQDRFGVSVAINNQYLFVGSLEDDTLDNTGNNSGKVYAYDTSNWQLVTTLSNPNPRSTSNNDRFSIGLTVNDEYLLVGAYQEYPSSAGAAYIYSINTASFYRLHTILDPNVYGTANGDSFGYQVALSGNKAIISAYDEDQAGAVRSGVLYAYNANANSGAQIYTVINPNAYGSANNDAFGFRVAANDKYILTCGFFESGPSGNTSGVGYILDVETGSLLATIPNPNAYGTGNTDLFGFSLAISNNYFAVAAQEDDAGGIQSGKVYVYRLYDPT